MSTDSLNQEFELLSLKKKKYFVKKSTLDTLIYVAINYIVILYWISLYIISMQLSRKLRIHDLTSSPGERRYQLHEGDHAVIEHYG